MVVVDCVSVGTVETEPALQSLAEPTVSVVTSTATVFPLIVSEGNVP